MEKLKIKETIHLMKCPADVDQRIYNYIQIYKGTKRFTSLSFFLISKIGIGIFSGFIIGFLSYRFISNSYVDSSYTDNTNSDITSINKGLQQIDYINSQL